MNKRSNSKVTITAVITVIILFGIILSVILLAREGASTAPTALNNVSASAPAGSNAPSASNGSTPTPAQENTREINYYIEGELVSTTVANAGELLTKPSIYGESYLVACLDKNGNLWDFDFNTVPDNQDKKFNLYLTLDLSEAYKYDKDNPGSLSYVYASLNITGGQINDFVYSDATASRPVKFKDLIRAYYTVTRQKHLFDYGDSTDEETTFSLLKSRGLVPNTKGIEDTASVKETVAVLADAYQSNYRAFVDNNFIDEINGEIYKDVSNAENYIRSALIAAYAFGVKLYESDNLRPDKTATQRQLAYIITLLDKACGTYLNYVFNSDGTISKIPVSLTYDPALIAEFNSNLKYNYQYIRSGVPLEAYSAPFINNVDKPADCFKESLLKTSYFNRTLSEYAKLCKEVYNVDMTIELDISMAYMRELPTDSILRPKLNISANPNNVSLAELFDIRTILNLYKEKLLENNQDETAVYDVFTEMYNYGYSSIFNNTTIRFICEGNGNTGSPADILDTDIYFEIVINVIADSTLDTIPRFVVYYSDKVNTPEYYINFEIMLLASDTPAPPPPPATDPAEEGRIFTGWVYRPNPATEPDVFKPVEELTSIPQGALQIFAAWEET